jgi:hypothetical protein
VLRRTTYVCLSRILVKEKDLQPCTIKLVSAIMGRRVMQNIYVNTICMYMCIYIYVYIYIYIYICILLIVLDEFQG